MDGKGRVLATVFVERRWRTVKYEDVYIGDTKPSRSVVPEYLISLNGTTRNGNIRRFFTTTLLRFILVSLP